MIVVKGNLIVNKSRIEPIQSLSHVVRQIQDRTYPVSVSCCETNPGLIICLANIDDYDLSKAIVINESTTVSKIDVDDLIIVSGDVIVIQEGGNV